jgi:Predicted permeases
MFYTIISVSVSLFIYIIIGVFFAKKGLTKKDETGVINQLLLIVFLPCAIIDAFQIEYSIEKLQLIIISMLLSFVFFIATYMIGYVIMKFKRETKNRSSTWIGCYTFSSILFIGIPVVNQLMGKEGLLILVAFNTVGNILLFSLGESVFTGMVRVSFKKSIRNPAILAAILGFLLFIGQITLPTALGSTVSLLGSFTAPISMIINGIMIGNRALGKIAIDKDNLFFVVMKLFFLPFVTMVLGSFLISNQQLFMLIVLVSSMPSGAVNSLLAESFNGNGKKASEYISLSTIVSVFTIPLMLVVFQFFFNS